MPVTLTDEQAEAKMMLENVIGQLLPTSEGARLLRVAIAALTREPAPADDCENIERVLDMHGRAWERCTDREPDDLGTWCDWCRHRGVVQPVDDGSSPFPEPTPCPNRELLREIDSFYSPISRMWAGQEPEDEFDVTHAQLVAKVRAALASAQPCAAPGDAACGTCAGGKVVDSGGVTPWGSSIDVPCPECAAPSAAGELARLEALLLERSPTCLRCGRKTGAVRYQTSEGGATCLDCHDKSAPGEAGEMEFCYEGEYDEIGQIFLGLLRGKHVRVYESRAPQPRPAPQSSEPPDPCATCGHDAMGHEGPWEREPPHRGQCCKQGCHCAVYRRAPEREGGDPDVR